MVLYFSHSHGATLLSSALDNPSRTKFSYSAYSSLCYWKNTKNQQPKIYIFDLYLDKLRGRFVSKFSWKHKYFLIFGNIRIIARLPHEEAIFAYKKIIDNLNCRNAEHEHCPELLPGDNSVASIKQALSNHLN
jgi:hypothetical protein